MTSLPISLRSRTRTDYRGDRARGAVVSASSSPTTIERSCRPVYRSTRGRHRIGPGAIYTHPAPWPDWRSGDRAALRKMLDWPIEGGLSILVEQKDLLRRADPPGAVRVANGAYSSRTEPPDLVVVLQSPPVNPASGAPPAESTYSSELTPQEFGCQSRR
jgi:hypothetical protein